MMFNLPSRWVYVYRDMDTLNNRISIANRDTLTKKQAEAYREQWLKTYLDINRVTLEDDDGNVIKDYRF